MLRKVELDEFMSERELRLRNFALDSECYYEEQAIVSMMQPKFVPTKNKLGKRPVYSRTNRPDRTLSRSPGSSRHHGLDFVKAVYSERTGQEDDWNYPI